MEFGDRTRFAVSMELDENSGDAWMLGKLCYWIGGKMVGNYDEGTSLRDVLFAMKWIIHDSGKRTDCARFAMPPEDVFASIDRSLYGLHENVESHLDDDPPARFDVCPQVDIFGQCKIYLVNCNDQTRVLYKNSTDLAVSEFILRHGEFDECIRLAWDELNILYDNAIDAET